MFPATSVSCSSPHSTIQKGNRTDKEKVSNVLQASTIYSVCVFGEGTGGMQLPGLSHLLFCFSGPLMGLSTHPRPTTSLVRLSESRRWKLQETHHGSAVDGSRNGNQSKDHHTLSSRALPPCSSPPGFLFRYILPLLNPENRRRRSGGGFL